jgi:hypothetical protein
MRISLRLLTSAAYSALRTLRYDNVKGAVKKVLRGYRREETSRFIAFRSHWRFQSEFCNPARGNEKGGVEGEGGYFRRNDWVPLPEARDLDELNAYLERCCREDQNRVLAGRSETVGAAMLIEHAHVLPLAAESFELVEISFPSVDGLHCVRVRTNCYSVPLRPGSKVEARVNADSVELWHEGKRVAHHERCYSRQQRILDNVLSHVLCSAAYVFRARLILTLAEGASFNTIKRQLPTTASTIRR